MNDVLSSLNIQSRLDKSRNSWNEAKPFGYVVIDDFGKQEACRKNVAGISFAKLSDLGTHFVYSSKKLTLQSGYPDSIQ